MVNIGERAAGFAQVLCVGKRHQMTGERKLGMEAPAEETGMAPREDLAVKH